MHRFSGALRKICQFGNAFSLEKLSRDIFERFISLTTQMFKEFRRLWKKLKLWHRCFLVNFAKYLRTHFLQNTSGQLLLTRVNLIRNYVYSSQILILNFECVIHSLKRKKKHQSTKKRNYVKI